MSVSHWRQRRCKRHAGVDLGDGEGHAECQDRQIDQRQVEDGGGFLLLQRIEDAAIPLVHRIGCGEIEQDDDEQRHRTATTPCGTSRSVQNRLRGVPESPQQVFARAAPRRRRRPPPRQLLDLLVDLLGLDRLGGLGLGLLGFGRLRRSVVGGLRFGRRPVGCLLCGPGLRLFGLRLVLIDIAGSIGRPAGTLTRTGGFRRTFGHICPGRLSRSSQLPWADEPSRSPALQPPPPGFSCADRIGVSGRFRCR